MLTYSIYLRNEMFCTYLQHTYFYYYNLNPILHTAWLDNHALTLKNTTANYNFGEKSSFLHTFLKFSSESRTIQVNF
jgi:hypothetical protein